MQVKKITAGFLAWLILCLALCGCSMGAKADPTQTTEAPTLQSEVVTDQPTTSGDPIPDDLINKEQAIDAIYTPEATEATTQSSAAVILDVTKVPAYSGVPYVAIARNVPDFSSKDLTKKSFERYSDLDWLGRCGVAYACVGKDLMPTGQRGSIGQVKPTGWQTVKYDIVDGKYLYNRCHLIGYQLTAENANNRNLITGTRYLNVDGMLPFENMVADYIKETGNHVLYRVTPVFEGNNLVAKGVEMEAMSVEDNGEGVLFHVFCYNVQPGVIINYATGVSRLGGKVPTTAANATSVKAPTTKVATTKSATTQKATTTKKVTTTKKTTAQGTTAKYILNTSTKKFHYSSCGYTNNMKEENKETYNGSRDDLVKRGFVPCKRCSP